MPTRDEVEAIARSAQRYSENIVAYDRFVLGKHLERCATLLRALADENEHRRQSTEALQAEVDRLRVQNNDYRVHVTEYADNAKKFAEIADKAEATLTAEKEKNKALVEALTDLLPDFTGGIDPIESEPVAKARALINQHKGGDDAGG